MFVLQDEVMTLFGINVSTGQIHLVRDIAPYDVGQTYSFTIVATDRGDPILTGTADVIVNVLNSSVNEFRFNTSYFYFTWPENNGNFEEQLTSVPGDAVNLAFVPDYSDNRFEFIANVSLCFCYSE